ncbi:hypothetical protein [Mycolicibacterium sp. PDY-3]|uniref:hypothetical protein n=1 Tax=Mycolicibacterium sp. PDY-3 TaxID=3376069 RepID=UPI0037BD46F9
MLKICTAAPAMNTLDINVPENARSASSVQMSLNNMAGICTIAATGVKMKPMAARCGSRLNNTACVDATRDNVSPMM